MDKVKVRLAYEPFVLTLAFLVLAVILTEYNAVRFYTLGTDSAGFVDLIRAVAENGMMVSPIFSSFYSTIPLLAAPPDVYCSSPLLSVHRTSDFLQWHPYFISYVLAVPVKYFGVAPLKIAAIINAINISGALALIYWFLRKNGLLVWECLSFIFAVAISQYWVGTLAGQFYFDRLFILPGLVLVLFCYEKWDGSYRAWLSIFFIAMLSSALISERTALLAGVMTLGYWFFLKGNHFKRKGIAVLLFSAASLAYLFIYMKFFQNSFYYSGLGWRTVLHNLNLALTPGGTLFVPTMMWMGVVSPMVILAFVNWRYGLLAVAAMVPNLLVSVGGAEKTGFATHYHAGYIPFLVGFAAIGYATLIHKVRGLNLTGTSWIEKTGKTVLIPVVVVLSGIAVSQLSEARQVYATAVGATSAFDAMVKKREEFAVFIASIPKDELISSPEWTMPTLASLGRTGIDYMPIGIGSNRYVIANYNAQSKLLEVPSYLDPSSKEQIAICIQNKLVTNYRVKLESELDGVRYVIYEKLL